MATSQWKKKLGGHAGELYVAAELSKRNILSSQLPENFSDDDIMAGHKEGSALCFVQVKSCHPDRSKSFILNESAERWIDASDNQFVAFVWLGSPSKNECPRYWIAHKVDVGNACVNHSQHGTANWERRFYPRDFDQSWENNWTIIEQYLAVE